MNAAKKFAAIARRTGLHIDHVDESGANVRVPVHGDQPGERSGWYVFNADAGPWAVFGNWRTGEKHEWFADTTRRMTDTVREQRAASVRCYQRAQRQRRAAHYTHIQGTALRQLARSSEADPAHPYLTSERVGAYGLRQLGPVLLIPLADAHQRVWNLQRIDPEGRKQLISGGRATGLFHLIGPPPHHVLFVAEDYAVAARIHEATGQPVALAFSDDNVEPAVAKLRSAHPHLTIVIWPSADTAQDSCIASNAVLLAGGEAASATHGRVAERQSRDATAAAARGPATRAEGLRQETAS